MSRDGELRLGALGGDSTFGGQAAGLFVQTSPLFGEVAYYETAGEMFAGVVSGRIDAACVPEQTGRAGFHERSQGRIASPGSGFTVLAEVVHEYHCALLALDGTSLADITTVLGHTGSVSQSRPWLEENLPQADIEIVDSNSLGAARLVASGDGSLASVGTPRAGVQAGLVELASDIDQGSVGNYWAVGVTQRFSREPTRWIVAARFGGDGRFGQLVASLHESGLALLTAYAQPTGEALFEYDHVLRFAGSGALADVESVLADFPEARLAGAFVPPDFRL